MVSDALEQKVFEKTNKIQTANLNLSGCLNVGCFSQFNFELLFETCEFVIQANKKYEAILQSKGNG